MADPLPYCVDSDVRGLNGFPDQTVVPPAMVNGWCAQRAGELNLLLRRKGVATPVTAPPDLVTTLKLANAYGAAAMLAAFPGNALGQEELKGFIDIWLTEFVRLENIIASLTKEDLLAMGVVMVSSAPATFSPPGMALARSKLTRAECDDFRNYYPYLKAEDYR